MGRGRTFRVQRLRQAPDAVRVDIQQKDVRALMMKRTGRRRADASGRAGDRHASVLQFGIDGHRKPL
ncbi:hypothetical protein D3C72_2438840 [compost metagenome]